MIIVIQCRDQVGLVAAIAAVPAGSLVRVNPEPHKRIKALQLVFEDRVFIANNKTIFFE